METEDIVVLQTFHRFVPDGEVPDGTDKDGQPKFRTKEKREDFAKGSHHTVEAGTAQGWIDRGLAVLEADYVEPDAKE